MTSTSSANAVTSSSTGRAIAKPYLVFLGDVRGLPNAKTGFGIVDWIPEQVVGQFRLAGCDLDLGVDDLSMVEAVERGAGSLLIGAAPVGGDIAPSWIASLVAALDAGLDIVSGLHARLSDLAVIAEAASRRGRAIHDLRHSDRRFSVATGRKRSGKRLLTVGTDCALGKKYASLAIARAMREAGMDADFRATGQTGIMISGEGVTIDAVISDFLAGAAESLSPDAAPDHWDVIEGQGALTHPAYAGVTLGLIHGSQPDALVLCHDPSRAQLNAFPEYRLPDIGTAIGLYEQAARLTNPGAQTVAISLNSSRLEAREADDLFAEMTAKYGLPCFDPLRSDLRPFVERLKAL